MDGLPAPNPPQVILSVAVSATNGVEVALSPVEAVCSSLQLGLKSLSQHVAPLPTSLLGPFETLFMRTWPASGRRPPKHVQCIVVPAQVHPVFRYLVNLVRAGDRTLELPHPELVVELWAGDRPPSTLANYILRVDKVLFAVSPIELRETLVAHVEELKEALAASPHVTAVKEVFPLWIQRPCGSVQFVGVFVRCEPTRQAPSDWPADRRDKFRPGGTFKFACNLLRDGKVLVSSVHAVACYDQAPIFPQERKLGTWGHLWKSVAPEDLREHSARIVAEYSRALAPALAPIPQEDLTALESDIADLLLRGRQTRQARQAATRAAPWGGPAPAPAVQAPGPAAPAPAPPARDRSLSRGRPPLPPPEGTKVARTHGNDSPVRSRPASLTGAEMDAWLQAPAPDPVALAPSAGGSGPTATRRARNMVALARRPQAQAGLLLPAPAPTPTTVTETQPGQADLGMPLAPATIGAPSN